MKEQIRDWLVITLIFILATVGIFKLLCLTSQDDKRALEHCMSLGHAESTCLKGMYGN